MPEAFAVEHPDVIGSDAGSNERQQQVRTLPSGVDSLYMSVRGEVRDGLLQQLSETRALANKDGTVLPEDESRKHPPVAVELTSLRTDRCAMARQPKIHCRLDSAKRA